MGYSNKEKQAVYQREYYLKNKQKYIEISSRYKIKKRLFIRESKSKPCMDCGVEYPYYVMQFDHVRGVKEFNIGRNLLGKGMAKIVAEMAKCDVVCANCHATRTFKRSKSTL